MSKKQTLEHLLRENNTAGEFKVDFLCSDYNKERAWTLVKGLILDGEDVKKDTIKELELIARIENLKNIILSSED